MSQRKLSAMVLAVTAVGAAGCEGALPGPDETTTTATGALTADNGLAWNGLAWNGLAYNGLSFNGLSWNGLAWNGLAYNGLSFNGLSWNGLAYNGLSWNGLSYNGLSWNGLADPNVSRLVDYVISCALPENDSVSYTIDGQTHTFTGELGLAPEWKTGACGEGCQRWMTACMLARLNHQGQHVRISMRGEHKALKVVRHETRDFAVREAAYFGNFFAAPDRVYACLSPGQTNMERVCGSSVGNCPMNVVGTCDDACRGTGSHRSFRDCSPTGQPRQDGYAETITVFLEPN